MNKQEELAKRAVEKIELLSYSSNPEDWKGLGNMILSTYAPVFEVMKEMRDWLLDETNATDWTREQREFLLSANEYLEGQPK